MTRSRRVRPPAALLFDRDGTLVTVPSAAEPRAVRAAPGARAALARARSHGVPTGVVSHQAEIGDGLVDAADVAAVNARVEELLGPFDVWVQCSHASDEPCGCLEPDRGLVTLAAAVLGVEPDACVVIGTEEAALEAAEVAGARAVLVPTEATPAAALREAPATAPTVLDAVERAIAGGL